MTATILAYEPGVRMAFFLGILLVMTAWESVLPRRARSFARRVRWPGNLGLVVLNSLIQRLLAPAALVGAAVFAAERSWGVLNQFDLPFWLGFVIATLALDLIVYLQHVVFHLVPFLWRLHRVHHADLDVDTTTGIRFHPVEIILSMVIKMSAVVAIGAPVFAVLCFEILLNATSLFNHANVRIATGVDAILRLFVVTPDMHRVHHSVDPVETNRNYGFNLPWWDRLFGTYRAQPARGHEGMTIGLRRFRSEHDLRIDRMLLQPFAAPAAVREE